MKLILKKVLLIIVASGFGLLLAEAFFYEGFLARYFGINSSQVFWLVLSFVALLRLLAKISLPAKLFSLLYSFIVPGLSLFTVFLNVAPNLFYQNFSFRYFHLHHVAMQTVSTFAMAILVISLQPKSLRHHARWSFFVTWIMLLSHLLFFKWKYIGTWFWKLRVEDGPFEYLTALSFLMIGILAVKTIKQLRHLQFRIPQFHKTMLVISFSLIAFGGFVVAGEEISWGQRLLNLNTPEKWAAVNTQEELTLHNHHHILHYVDHAYLALSVYGTFAWLFVFSYKRLFGQRRPHSQIANWIAMLVPSWHLMPLFIPSMMHAVGVFTTEWTYYGLGTWSETTEMLLSFGLFFYMLDVKNNIEKIVKNWISIISHEKPLINA